LLSHLENPQYIREFLVLVWPVALDKGTMALAYIWLSKMIAPLGTCSVATFCIVKDMERFAFLPAIACAQVITILVSNDYGAKDWKGIIKDIQRVLLMASLMVGFLLFSFCIFTQQVAGIFDKNGDFTELTIRVFPFLSVLVFFDLLQLVLSGALRGANNVKVVMFTRLVICLLYFVPVSYGISKLSIADPGLKFLLIYGSFYVGNALMSIIYIKRFCGQRWKTKEL
jgi:MATE family multidrug resistance protein